MRRLTLGLAAAGLLLGACMANSVPTVSTPSPTAPTSPTTTSPPPTTTLVDPTSPPTAPEVPAGPLDPELLEDLDTLIASLASINDRDALARIGESGDARVAWLLADFLRFVQVGPAADTAKVAFDMLTGANLSDGSYGSNWVTATNLLISWDLPAPPEYLDLKGRIFVMAESRWEPFFEEEAQVDWRHVSWGGVFIDDRPTGDDSTCSRGCIPALDDPVVTPATDGSWYPDDSLIFGVEVNGEARAYPKNMMEIHEMVNDTLGGRRLGIPYCTLCGSAQAYLTDEVPEGVTPPLLRTSGLLIRSNKMMFDLNTFSLIDTFRGNAVSGPLAEQGVQLEQLSVITSTWGAWKDSHPETTILAEDGGLGRTYPADPLGGRDAGGPIFPIGDVDPRLPVQAQVLGVETPDGQFVAFPVDQAKAAIESGEDVELAGVLLVSEGGGLRAELADDGELAGHQSFWFAWSQFHPETLLWTPGFGG